MNQSDLQWHYSLILTRIAFHSKLFCAECSGWIICKFTWKYLIAKRPLFLKLYFIYNIGLNHLFEFYKFASLALLTFNDEAFGFIDMNVQNGILSIKISIFLPFQLLPNFRTQTILRSRKIWHTYQILEQHIKPHQQPYTRRVLQINIHTNWKLLSAFTIVQYSVCELESVRGKNWMGRKNNLRNENEKENCA